jgi:DNA gyrase inhibitor GyrI
MKPLRSASIGSFLPLAIFAACTAPAGEPQAISSATPAVQASEIRASLDLPVSEPPYDAVHANYKERLDQPYVFLEIHGSYTETARELARVRAELTALGVEPSGPPFALFYDDPGHTPVAALRSRACIPVATEVAPKSPFAFDILPSATVAYAYVGGAYPDVPRAYPGIYAFMTKMHWVENGPIRESYLVPPSSVTNWSSLVCEVQIPVAPGH